MSQAWTAFGHAMWRCEVGGHRLLIDPVLSPTHQDGVFSLQPPRTFDLDGLDDPIVVVTHRHPDHFDPASLAALASRGERLLLTADPWVADVGRRLGFAWTRVLAVGEAVPLGSATLLTTPSRASVPEWGLLVVDDDGVVWNQVDTALGPPEGMPALMSALAAAVGRERLDVDLLIARWSPTDQISPCLGGSLGFPLGMYSRDLARIAVVNPRFVVPGAGETRYADPDHWLQRHAYPVSQARFLRDVAARVPGVQSCPLVVGRRFEVGGGVTWADVDGPVRGKAVADPRRWHPTEVPPVQADPGSEGAWARVSAWVDEALCPALARASVRWDAGRPLRLRLDVVGAERRSLTLTVDPSAAVREACSEEDWDALVEVGLGGLDAVIAGRSPWGRLMLDGQLRSYRRAYRVGEGGVSEVRLPAIFLYAALPYEAAFVRWVEGVLDGMAVGPAQTG